MAKQAAAPALTAGVGRIERSGDCDDFNDPRRAGSRCGVDRRRHERQRCKSVCCQLRELPRGAGTGHPERIPPLANNPVVTGDPQKVIGILTAGLHGQISVGGMSYNGQMPAWKGQLSSKDIADVITYIRGGLEAITPQP